MIKKRALARFFVFLVDIICHALIVAYKIGHLFKCYFSLSSYQNFHHAFLPAKLLVAVVLPLAAVVLAAEAAAAPATLSFLVPF